MGIKYKICKLLFVSYNPPNKTNIVDMNEIESQLRYVTSICKIVYIFLEC